MVTLHSLLSCLILYALMNCLTESGEKGQPSAGALRVPCSKCETEISKLINSDQDFDADSMKELQKNQPDEVIEAVIRIKLRIPVQDCRQLRIALISCMFNYQYKTNKNLLISALYPDSRFFACHAEDTELLLYQLIKKGDKTILKVLFDTLKSSDGALTEAIADTIKGEIESSISDFLSQLKDSRPNSRMAVYKLITSTQGTEIAIGSAQSRSYLLSMSSDPKLGPVARELLSSMAVEGKLGKPK